MGCPRCDVLGDSRSANHLEGEHVPAEAYALDLVSEEDGGTDLRRCPGCKAWFVIESRVDNDIFSPEDRTEVRRISASTASSLLATREQWRKARRAQVLRDRRDAGRPKLGRLPEAEGRVLDVVLAMLFRQLGLTVLDQKASLSPAELDAVVARLVEKELLVIECSHAAPPWPAGTSARDFTTVKVRSRWS